MNAACVCNAAYTTVNASKARRGTIRPAPTPGSNVAQSSERPTSCRGVDRNSPCIVPCLRRRRGIPSYVLSALSSAPGLGLARPSADTELRRNPSSSHPPFPSSLVCVCITAWGGSRGVFFSFYFLFISFSPLGPLIRAAFLRQSCCRCLRRGPVSFFCVPCSFYEDKRLVWLRGSSEPR